MVRDAREIIQVALSLLERGLVTETAGNISIRQIGGRTMLITPSGRDYLRLTERDLVEVDLVSGQAEGPWRPSSEWRLHFTAYQARPDVNAVIHHHAVWASAVAVARKSIPVLIDEAADIGPIPTARYALSGSQELADSVAAELNGGSNAVLLANHGAVAVGSNLREAFRRAVEVERLARIYLGAMLLGGPQPLDEAAVARSREFLAHYRASAADSPLWTLGVPRVEGQVGFPDLVTYGFRAGVTFASMLHALVMQKLHR